MNVHESAPHLTSDPEELAVLAAVTAEAKEHWHDPAWRSAMAKTLHEQIWWGFAHENLLNYFTEVESVEVGDDIVIEEVFGVEVFWHALGGQIDQTDVTSNAWKMIPYYLGFHFSLFETEMREKFARKSQLLIRSCIDQMDAAISSRLFRTVQRAVPGISHPSFIGNPGVSLAQVEQAVSEVGEESYTSQVAIVGRRSMTDQIMSAVRNQNGFTPQTNEEILRNGHLGWYWGVPIIQLQNHKDRKKRSYFPANEMLVIARDASKVGFWGGLTTKEGNLTPLSSYWHYTGTRSAGFAVHHTEAMRRIVDTSKNP